jgi:SAM-dependent methyltransferase
MMAPYFTDADARSIIGTTYAKACGQTPSVAESLYTPAELAGLPAGAVALALGVGNPLRAVDLRPGLVVLDVGCGGGLDALIAAQRVGPGGRVLGLDMAPAMVERAREYAARMGVEIAEFHEGLMEALPFPDASVDVVVSNGALNLSTRKSRTLAEMHRVLRPGGRLALADLVLTETLPEAIRRDPTALAV